MLENDGVGQRSGTRPFAGLVVSQKKSNVRRWRSSRNGSNVPFSAEADGPAEQARKGRTGRRARAPSRLRRMACSPREYGAPAPEFGTGARDESGQKVYRMPSWKRRGAPNCLRSVITAVGVPRFGFRSTTTWSFTIWYVP